MILSFGSKNLAKLFRLRFFSPDLDSKPLTPAEMGAGTMVNTEDKVRWVSIKNAPAPT